MVADKFNPLKQCPQLYLYIFSVLTSIALAYRFQKQAIFPITISGIIVTFILMTMNFCSWQYEWLTWVFATLFLLSSITNLIGVFTTDKKLIKELEEVN